jgi:hypothetical protein
MSKIYEANGREFWIAFDSTARVYEMFASRDADDYLGCFDTVQEAVAYAKAWRD